MDLATELTPQEQKYFDTRGADLPAAPEPVVVPSPAPAAIDPPVPEPEEGAENEQDNPGKFVRHGAFHEERERRKELQKTLEDERRANAERNGRLEERLNMLNQALNPPAEAPCPPAPETDAMGNLKYVNQRLDTIAKQLETRGQQEQQNYQQQQAQQAFADSITNDEKTFLKTTPDYLEAVEFGKQSRLGELIEMGYTEQRAQQILMNDIIYIADEALREGRSPAQTYYNFAKYRGYAKAAPEVPAPDAKIEATAKLKNIAAGQAAGKSLGAAPGSSTPQLTLEAIANMSDDDFKAIALDKKQWKKLVGGA